MEENEIIMLWINWQGVYIIIFIARGTIKMNDLESSQSLIEKPTVYGMNL